MIDESALLSLSHLRELGLQSNGKVTDKVLCQLTGLRVSELYIMHHASSSFMNHHHS